MLNASSTTAWNEEVHEVFLLANFPVVVQADSPEHTQALMAAKTPVIDQPHCVLTTLKLVRLNSGRSSSRRSWITIAMMYAPRMPSFDGPQRRRSSYHE